MSPRRFDVPCRISLENSEDHFHAHVELDGDLVIHPGDKVQVHGDPIHLPFGQSATFARTATVTRAGPLARTWMRLISYLEVTELYEVSFTSGRLK